MNTDFRSHVRHHHRGESATHPIELANVNESIRKRENLVGSMVTGRKRALPPDPDGFGEDGDATACENLLARAPSGPLTLDRCQKRARHSEAIGWQSGSARHRTRTCIG